MAVIALFWNAAIFFSIFQTAYLLPTVSSGCVQYACMKGWFQYGPNCYKLEKNKLSWEEATFRCSRLGGHLASVHSDDQLDFLNHFFEHEHSNLWIGLRYSEKDRNYMWEDGSEFDFIIWSDNEPSHYFGHNPELCVEMRPPHVRGVRGYWNDLQCKERRASICQAKNHDTSTEIVTTIAPTSTTSQSRKPRTEEVDTEATLGSKNSSPISVGSEEERKQFIAKCTEIMDPKISESEALAEYISTKLGKVEDPEQRMHAESLLTKVLNKAIMNKLTKHTHLTHASTSHSTSYSTPAPPTINNSTIAPPNSTTLRPSSSSLKATSDYSYTDTHH